MSSTLVHLVRRFFGSLSRRPVPIDDQDWVRSHLLAGEWELWCRMPLDDRRHAVGVARATVDLLGPDATRPVVAAALLHDVGKIESGFGTLARVAATVTAGLLGRRRAMGAARTGIGRRLADYLRHDEIGARLIDRAGGDPLTVAWAREHHLPVENWSIDRRVASALKQADDD